MEADYFVGIDWLVEGEHVIQVEPKINTKVVNYFNEQLAIEEGSENEAKREGVVEEEIKNPTGTEEEIIELNYLAMLLDVLAQPATAKEISKLVLIDWVQIEIPIKQNQDRLTPFLIIQFLQSLKSIARKGLKKSYYKKRENLRNRVKGKILVGQHVKSNVFKNNQSSTYCEYQVFGEDILENRFLKKVFRFASGYVENNKRIFGENLEQIERTINFCRPVFEHISEEIDEQKLKHLKHHSFFKEYKEAIEIGKTILRKFAYNISKTSDRRFKTPPFWIDMPRLFELYFYAKLLKHNPTFTKNIHFQFGTYGNSLDFLISEKGYEMIIDTKYKLNYKWGKIHKDIRQISGYARLTKVRTKLGLGSDSNKIIDCLVVYPDLGGNDDVFSLENILNKRLPINMYNKVYKIGMDLPIVKKSS